MKKIKVLNTNELDGNGQVLTELSIQGYDSESLSQILRPMGFSKEEMYYILESVDPNWENVDYLYNLYLAWAESEEN